MAGGKLKKQENIMLHTHTIWKLMRKYTDRQITDESVELIKSYLEKQIKT